jgi:hypothetical protein
MANKRLPQRAQHVDEDDHVVRHVGNCSAECLERCQQPAFTRRGRFRLPIGAMHLFEQAPVALRQGTHTDLLAPGRPLPRQALEQPRAVGVELGHAAHVDGGGARLRHLAGDALDQGLEVVRMDGRPGAACRELQPPVPDRAAQCRLAAQCFLRGWRREISGDRSRAACNKSFPARKAIDFGQRIVASARRFDLRQLVLSKAEVVLEMH